MGERPTIPAELRREVLVEAGHRCAIPTCRNAPVDVHHINEDSRDNAFENLIALCPNDHRRVHHGEIDRKAIRMYKRNLGIVNGRYGELEQRLLDLFAHQPEKHVYLARRNMDFEFMYLLRDGLIKRDEREGGVFIGGIRQGAEVYSLTQAGIEFVARWSQAQPLGD